MSLSALCVMAATGALVGYGIYSAAQTSSYVTGSVDRLLDTISKESLQRLASTQAGIVQTEVDSAFASARNMARGLEVIAAKPEASGTPTQLRRAQLNALLLGVLKDNPRFNGTYSAWMPNALDGADVEFVGRKELGSDATGRGVPYWTRDAAGSIAVQTLVEFDSRELHPNGVMKGGWFIGPQTTGKESILAPLNYIVQGKPVFLATMSVPITVDGTFKGVAGADFDLSFVQALAEKVNGSIYEGKGSVTIASNSGLLIASSTDPKAIGRPFSVIDPQADASIAILRNGEATVRVDAQHAALKVYAPIVLGRTGATWSLIISVPQALVMAEANTLKAALDARGRTDLFWQVVSALAVTGLALVAMAFVAGGVSGPIARLTSALRRMAAGEHVAEIAGADRKDEIGDISRAVDQIRLGIEEEGRRKASEAEASRLHQDQERRATMMTLAAGFENAMGDVVNNVGSASDQLSSAATTMTSATRRVASESETAAAASEDASSNVQTVASAAVGTRLLHLGNQAPGGRFRPYRRNRRQRGGLHCG